MKPTTHWTLDDALKELRDLNPKLRVDGYCVALTGGVLFKGESDKDLDLVLYPLGQNDTPYLPALNTVRQHFNALTCYAVEQEFGSKGKSIFVLNQGKGGKRIDVFIPHVRFDQRKDPIINVDTCYADLLGQEVVS